jgi:hypothetical protein
MTALAQATNTPDEADFQLRTIFGIGFDNEKDVDPSGSCPR